MLCHLAALAGIHTPFGNVIGPLVVWLIKRNDSPAVDRDGKESLNFQLSMSIYFSAGVFAFVLAVALSFLAKDKGMLTFLPLAAIGIVMLWMLSNLVLVVVASIKASKGEAFRYPLTIQFLR